MVANHRTAWVACAAVLAAVLAVACAEGQDDRDGPVPSTNTKTPLPLATVPAGDPSSPSDYAHVPEGDSLRSMLEYHRNVIVGEVLTQTGVVYVDDLPKTGYAVRTEEVIAGDGIASGDEITLLVTGGAKKNGQVDPLQGPVKVGSTYLLFLADFRKIGYPGFGGFGFARFQLTLDRRIIPNGSEGYPAVEAISGVPQEEVHIALGSSDRDGALLSLARVKLDEAAQLIKRTIAEGPLPGVPRWLQPYLDYWELFPTPSPAAAPASPAAVPPTPAVSP